MHPTYSIELMHRRGSSIDYTAHMYSIQAKCLVGEKKETSGMCRVIRAAAVAKYRLKFLSAAALLVREDLRRQRTGPLQTTRWAIAQYGNDCGRHRIITAGKCQLAPLLLQYAQSRVPEYSSGSPFPRLGFP